MPSKDKDRILRRIKKCLALSESDNEHEAANALRQAQALMQKHGIELEEAQQEDFEVRDQSEGKRSRSTLTQPEMMLFSVVCEFFGCSIYSSGNWPVIVGVAPAPEIAEYAAGTLLRQLRQNRRDALAALEDRVNGRLSTSAKRDFNRSYSSTWVYAVNAKIADFAQTILDEEKAQHEKAIKKHWGQTEIQTRAFQQSHTDNAITRYAELQGALDGRKAELNHGVGEGPGQARIE